MQYTPPVKENIHGLLWLDKPLGLSSNRALQAVKRLFKAKKAGHGGSLDPLATGLLPICFGEMTKYLGYLLEANKTYTVTARLGIQTSSGDAEGEPIAQCADEQKIKNQLEVDQLCAHLKDFVGSIEQVPPVFSALKHQGRPLYSWARRGVGSEDSKEVHNIALSKKRMVQVFAITLEGIEVDRLSVCLRITCSKGTYIRSLINDIGLSLGCYAHVTALRREAIGRFSLLKNNIQPFDLKNHLDKPDQVELQSYLSTIDAWFMDHPTIPAFQLDVPEQSASLLQGKSLMLQLHHPSLQEADLIAIFNANNQFIGLCTLKDQSVLIPVRMMSGNSVVS